MNIMLVVTGKVLSKLLYDWSVVQVPLQRYLRFDDLLITEDQSKSC